ncbi:MAG: cation:proton antiporter [Armatimonadetes bacterium]|nr:cation:proton antiporter [Armatimonadota bacterium]
MPQHQLIVDLGIILFVALVAGLVAHRLRVPLLLAYLVGGIAIGPHVLGIIGQAETISIFAEIGVTLLMFALGVEFSLQGVFAVRSVAIKGGLLQIAATIALGYVVGRLLRLGLAPSLVLGAALSLSSTMIVMKMLMDRGETETTQGRVMLGILIVQDLAVVAMLALLPILPALSLSRLPELAGLLLKAAAYLVFAVVLARTIIPRVMRFAAASQHKELFALTVVGICFSAALATLAIGFSLALGAFVAGLIVSESEYRHEVFAEVIPLRDVFAVLFFVSVGMLVDPAFFLRRLGDILLVVGAILLGKSMLTAVIVRAFHYHPRTAFLVGAGLAQIGEFSFLLARQAQLARLISDDVYGIILSAALVTILLTPIILARSPEWYRRFPAILVPARVGPAPEGAEHPPPRDHVVIIGYGRVGNNVGASLMLYGIPFVAVDYDQGVVEQLRRIGFPAIFGDGSLSAVLTHAHPETARMAVVTVPDFLVAQMAVRNLRAMNPDLRIVARVAAMGSVSALYEAGAEEVVQPEFEAGIELTRHALVRLGIPLPEVQAQTERLRRLRYGAFADAESRPTAAELRDHYIICGFGRQGSMISRELAAHHVPHAIVEREPERIAGTSPPGVPIVLGDATDTGILRRAGVEHARGLVAVTPSDVDNLYVIATARQLNPDIFILSRVSEEGESGKFRQAGADRVISPYVMGARQMVSEILHPHLARFLEITAGDGGGPWSMEEVRIHAGSPLDGKVLGELEAPGVKVVGLITCEGVVLGHPGPCYDLGAGDVLVAAGAESEMALLRRLASGEGGRG